jgi:hypothetical protein
MYVSETSTYVIYNTLDKTTRRKIKMNMVQIYDSTENVKTVSKAGMSSGYIIKEV